MTQRQATESLQSRPLQRKIDNIMNLAKKQLIPENYVLLCKYQKELFKESVSTYSCITHLQVIKKLTELINNKNWKDTTKNDIDNLIILMMKTYGNQNGQETATSASYKRMLKPFLRWVKTGIRSSRECQRQGMVEPIEVRQIIIKSIQSKLTREDLLTPAELANLLAACGENLRNRAFIDSMSEVGPRASELLTCKIKHVRQDDYGIILSVDGKTGPRPIRLIRSAPTVTQWLNVHPLKDDPNAPLWIRTRKDVFGKPLSYAGAYMLVRKLATKSGITKRIHMHLFRHTAATESSSFMNQEQQKILFGWSKQSQMPSHYTHLNFDDVDDTLLAHYGMKKDGSKKAQQMPKKCHICETINSPQNDLCDKCSRPLDMKAAMQIDKHKSKEIDELNDKIRKQTEQQLKTQIEMEFMKTMVKEVLAQQKPEIIKV